MRGNDEKVCYDYKQTTCSITCVTNSTKITDMIATDINGVSIRALFENKHQRNIEEKKTVMGRRSRTGFNKT